MLPQSPPERPVHRAPNYRSAFTQSHQIVHTDPVVSLRQSEPSAFQRWIADGPLRAWLVLGLSSATALALISLPSTSRAFVAILWLWVGLGWALVIRLIRRPVTK